MERDFDSHSGFEERLIEDQERNDYRSFSNQMLLYIQGLGAREQIAVDSDDKGREVYIKGANAEACLKSLCVQCRKDIPDRPLAKLILATYCVCKRDLMSLFNMYPQDKMLSYYVLMLFETITDVYQSGIHLTTPYVHEMQNALRSYKILFSNSWTLKTLLNHFTDCFTENRTSLHDQTIELIVLLVRNLLQIPDDNELNLQRQLLQGFLENSIFDAMNYYTTDSQGSAMMRKLSLPLTEIFYNLYTPFDQEWLLRTQMEDNMQRIKEKRDYEQEKLLKRSTVPSRHSRFAGLFKTKREFSNTFQISSVPFHTHQVNKLANQRYKPIARAIVAKHKTILPKRIILEKNAQERFLKEDLKTSTIEFLQHSFNPLVLSAYDELNKECAEPNDKIHYYVLVAHILKFARLYIKKEFSKGIQNNGYSQEFHCILAALQVTQFELVFSDLMQQCTQLKKRNINYRIAFAALYFLQEYLQIIKDLQLSTQQIDRQNSSILMEAVLTREISKILRIGFSYCTFGLFNDQLLKTLVQLSALYYDLFESYSQGKIVKIRTNKLIKKKIKKEKQKEKKKQEKEANLEHEYEQDLEGGQNESESGSEDDEEEEENEHVYKDRASNLKSVLADIVEYPVIEKYFYLIKDDQLLSNHSELNIAIYKYFKRIVDLLKADWIFFQVDFLYTINSILQNKIISYRNEFQNLMALFRRISLSFIQLLKVNRLAAVEILFRIPDVATKDSILKNYSDVQHEEVQYEAPQPAKTVWTQVEDKALIENYERYKDSPNPEEQLSLILNNLGFSMKTPQEIRKRIKKFCLNEGTDQAIQKYHQLYERISMRKEEIMTRSVKELLLAEGGEGFKMFFSQLFAQVRSYIEYRGKELVEIPLPPITQTQFEHFEKQAVQQLLLGLDFKSPQQGEVYWRLHPYIFEKEVAEMEATLQKYIERAKKLNNLQLIEEYQPLQMELQKNASEMPEQEQPELVEREQQKQEKQESQPEAEDPELEEMNKYLEYRQQLEDSERLLSENDSAYN